MRRKPIIAIACIAAICAAATFSLTRQQSQNPSQQARPGEADPLFDFIGKLGGKPHALANYEPAKGNEAQCYVFDGQKADDLVKTLTGEIGEPTLDTGFMTTAIWIKKTDRGRFRVTVAEAAGDHYNYSSFRPGFVVVEGPPEVLTELGSKYGWKKDLPYQEEVFFAHPDDDVYFMAYETPPAENAAVYEYTWCNVSDADITLVIDDYQKNQYDTVERMPMSVRIPALGKAKTRFTLPLASTELKTFNGGDGDAFSYHYVTADGVVHQSPQTTQAQEHELHISVEPVSSPTKRQLVLFIEMDPTGRPLEASSINIDIGGKSVFSTPGPLRSKTGRGLRIPFVYTGVRGDQKLRGGSQIPRRSEHSVARGQIRGAMRPVSLLLPASIVALVAVSGPVQQNVARIVTIDGHQHIQIQGKTPDTSFLRPYNGLLPGRPSGRFEIGNGLVVSTERKWPQPRSTLLLSRGNQVISRLDLYAEVQKWLRSDSLWGGHETANQMRYIDHRSPLGPEITETIPQPDGSALAVVDYMGESALSLTVQANLIRISPKPFKVTHLKSLAPAPDWGNAISPQRIYRHGHDIFVIDGSTLYQYSRGRLKKWASLPFAPVGLVSGRYLILAGRDERAAGGRKTKTYSLDLSTHRSKLLDSAPYGDASNGAWSDGPRVFSNSPYISLETIIPNPGEVYNGRNYTIETVALRVDTGKRTRLPRLLTFVGEYGYCYDREPGGASTTGGTVPAAPPPTSYLIYSLRTGKLVQSLKIPDRQR